MKTNLRKEQEKLAVLLEITETPKKNAEIIKGAEGRLIMDEAYTRLLSDKKTTAGKKELQFILYFLKKDNLLALKTGVFTQLPRKLLKNLSRRHTLLTKL